MDVVGNDIVLRSTVDAPNREDSGIQRMDLSAYDSLQVEDDLSSEHNWVLGRLRLRTMTAHSFDRNVDRVNVSHGKTTGPAQRANGLIMTDVQRNAIIRNGKFLEKSIGKHHPGSRTSLFGWLSNEQQSATPMLP